MQNPAALLPDATKGAQYLIKAIGEGGAPQKTLELVHMRVSQINGCSACIEYGLGAASRSGEALERLVRLPAWRESDAFTDAERDALALAEAATRTGRTRSPTRSGPRPSATTTSSDPVRLVRNARPEAAKRG